MESDKENMSFKKFAKWSRPKKWQKIHNMLNTNMSYFIYGYLKRSILSHDL